jgi:hypothetical protein
MMTRSGANGEMSDSGLEDCSAAAMRQCHLHLTCPPNTAEVVSMSLYITAGAVQHVSAKILERQVAGLEDAPGAWSRVAELSSCRFGDT